MIQSYGCSQLRNINNNFNNTNRTFTTVTDAVVYDNTSGTLVPFGKINKGETYPIVNDFGPNWYRVIFSGRVGFVRKSDTDNEGMFFQALENVPVYNNETGSLVEVGQLKKGEVYPIVRDYGNWHRIEFAGKYGYVRKTSTTFVKGNRINNLNKNLTNSNTMIKTIRDTVVYDNTSGQLVPFGMINASQQFPIIRDFGNWYKITYAGRIGYVSKRDVVK